MITFIPATFRLDCPHCGTAHVAFELTGESWLPRNYRWHVCARCNYCSAFVVIELSSLLEEESSPSSYYMWRPERFSIEKIYHASEREIPAHLPEEIARLFKQGMANVPANPDAAGTMFRKTLEATLRDRCPAATGSLINRIDQAARSGVLTADLGHYAHTIRLEGNEAAHGTYDEADARQLHSLVKLVLQYVYTLPGMQAQIDASAKANTAAQRGTAASRET